MSGSFRFLRIYAQYGADIREFERTEAVSSVLSAVVSEFEYPVSCLIGAKVSSQWLKVGEASSKDASALDLIFEMQGVGFLEIVMRDADGVVFYGGWLEKGETYRLTKEIVNGYRVIDVKTSGGDVRRHVYSDRHGYQPVYEGAPVPAEVARRLRQQIAR
ncbi:MAG: hypothetical protein ACRBB0_16270 [Pelagimonas sp.]|uniref:hypothetical protein n=1 Tax=Pelagimonas sp. TaxID=2073170 RepID=UPI003D6A4BBE